MSEVPTPPAKAPAHAFVVRLRLDPARPTGADDRLLVRVEDVNRADISQHDTIDNALGWLRTRMTALVPPRTPDAPPPDRSKRSSPDV